MNWLLLAEETTDLSSLLKLGGFGSLVFALGVLTKFFYERWRQGKEDSKKDALDGFELQLKKDKEEFEQKKRDFELESLKGDAKLKLSIAEDDQIESQFQRIIESQSKFITELQTKRDKRVSELERRMEEVQRELNKCTENHARAETRNEYFEKRLTENDSREKQLRDELNEVKRKYYTLKKNGGKSHNDSGSDFTDLQNETLTTPDEKTQPPDHQI